MSISALIEKLKQQLGLKFGEQSLLLVRLGTEPQALLMSKAGDTYGIEECCGKDILREERMVLEEILKEICIVWKLKEDQLQVALMLEDLYQEEFMLPNLPIKQLKAVIHEEIRLRVPLPSGSYETGYSLKQEESEYRVQIGALNKERLRALERAVEARGWKLKLVTGGSFLPVIESEKLQFWNCFCEKAKEAQMQEMYSGLIALGQSCLGKGNLVNVLKPVFCWQDKRLREKLAAVAGLTVLGVNLIGMPWLQYKTKFKAEEKTVLEQRLKQLDSYRQQQIRIKALEQAVNKKQRLFQQLKSETVEKAFWMEILGRVMPTSCWLNTLEIQGNIIRLQGKASGAVAVELLRKQLLATGKCRECELVECRQEEREQVVSFGLKMVI